MAKVTSPAPAKSGQAKTRGTTKTAAAKTAMPDEIVAGAAPAAAPIVEPAAPVAGSTQIQDGEPGGSTSTENTLQDGAQPAPGNAEGADAGNPTGESGEIAAQLNGGTGDDSAVTPGDGAGEGEGEGGGSKPELNASDLDDEPQEQSLPALSAKLVNHSNMSQRIVKARIALEPGESAVIEFRDDKHREQCEKHVRQIRSLYRWAEGEGLHWSADE